MSKTASHTIAQVAVGSPADFAGLEPGDSILAVNGQPLEDIFDYYFLIDEADPVLIVRDAQGTDYEVEIEKDEGEDLGVTFEYALLDDYRRCSNACIFCFIDQMPPGMRETLYFKDDDTRLSFLQGNYVTLTNLKDDQIERMIRYRLAPINISVHTTNPQLRVKMLKNRFAGNIMERLARLYEAELPMNGQIVLCKGYNDGEELDRSLADLLSFAPVMQSVSVVPVGLTRYREGLCPLEAFTKEDAIKVIAQIEAVQQKARAAFGNGFVYAADEWYLLAEQPLPPEVDYDGYPQLENGVGMLRALNDEFEAAIAARQKDPAWKRSLPRSVSIATGKLAAPFLKDFCRRAAEAFPGFSGTVYEIRNDFFGEQITVSGLITGQDLQKQLSDQPLYDALLLPGNMLRAEEAVFLDDMTVRQLEEALQVSIQVSGPRGEDLLRAMLGA